MKPSMPRSVLALSLVLVLGACSSKKTREGDNTDVIPAATDAGTDAIPQPATETPPGPDGSSPPQADSSAPPSSPASDTGGSTQTDSYTVQKGDTLMKIAFETLGDVYKWKDIFEANKDKIKDPNSIPSGVVLKIDKPSTPVALDKNGERYLIKQGDTLGKISNELYGTKTKWKEIWENNKQLIKNPNRIFAGFFLYYVPGAGGSPRQTPTSTSNEPLANSGGADNSAAPPPSDPNTGSARVPTSANDAAGQGQPPAPDAAPVAPPPGNTNPQ